MARPIRSVGAAKAILQMVTKVAKTLPTAEKMDDFKKKIAKKHLYLDTCLTTTKGIPIRSKRVNHFLDKDILQIYIKISQSLKASAQVEKVIAFFERQTSIDFTILQKAKELSALFQEHQLHVLKNDIHSLAYKKHGILIQWMRMQFFK